MHVNKSKKNLALEFSKNIYLVSLWTGSITSLGLHEWLLWQSSRPSRWHPQHMWHDLLQRGYTRAPHHCANSRPSPQMCVGPPGTRQQNEMPITLWLCSCSSHPHTVLSYQDNDLMIFTCCNCVILLLEIYRWLQLLPAPARPAAVRDRRHYCNHSTTIMCTLTLLLPVALPGTMTTNNCIITSNININTEETCNPNFIQTETWMSQNEQIIKKA